MTRKSIGVANKREAHPNPSAIHIALPSKGLTACMLLLSFLSVVGCWRSGGKSESASERKADAAQGGVSEGPRETLEGFISALKGRRRDAALQYVLPAERMEFEAVLNGVDGETMHEVGTDLERERYVLDEASERRAIFWSAAGKKFLVLTREGGKWYVDPGRTDEMNGERTMEGE